MKFKDLRDVLIHPRKVDDDTELITYDTQVSQGLAGIIEIMNSLSLGMFKAPLRPQILDLKPE